MTNIYNSKKVNNYSAYIPCSFANHIYIIFDGGGQGAPNVLVDEVVCSITIMLPCYKKDESALLS